MANPNVLLVAAVLVIVVFGAAFFSGADYQGNTLPSTGYTVSTNDIADNAVIASKIANNAVTATKLAKRYYANTYPTTRSDTTFTVILPTWSSSQFACTCSLRSTQNNPSTRACNCLVTDDHRLIIRSIGGELESGKYIDYILVEKQ